MSNSKNTKASTLALVQALIAGTQKHSPNGQFTLGNASYTAASLITLFESLANAMIAESAAEGAAKEAVLAVRNTGADVRPLMGTYKKYLQATYGNAVQTLADYGLTPAKVAKPLTVKALSAKVQLNEATRKARGTVGPKKRLEIKGSIATPAEDSSPVVPAALPAKPTAQGSCAAVTSRSL
jgi:hypothetical protein